ncbi:MAG: peptide chain release factor N(5)-glutamine methyltransferase [Pirellulales bacterium]|nr:peptide chain release factor N(5)-glutamine methyltransferase [Pirellulales bacterium]
MSQSSSQNSDPPHNNPWTVGRLLQWTADYLKGHGSDSPRLDAEVLLADVLRWPRIQLYANFDAEPDESARSAYRELVRRRAAGTPVAYLVGHREFYSLDFQVTPDVLIPRPETELLVVALLDAIKNSPLPLGEGSGVRATGPGVRVLEIADVGTGSGILAVCAAKHLPHCRVTAVDVSPAALKIAAANAEKHNVSEMIEFLESDLFSAVPADRQFDFILSNPPYVADGEWQSLPPDVKNFEPKTALLAGPRGTEVIEKLLSQAVSRLHPGGCLLIEISPQIHEAVCALVLAQSGLELLPTIKDLARLPRVVQAKKR